MSYRNNNNYNQRRSSNDSGHFGGYRVYVGDIGQRIGRTDLEKEFGQYGPVTDVWMGKKHDQNTQDYAFIVYRYPEDADEAVRDRNGRKLCGRVVRVEHAKPIGSVSRRGRGDWRGGNRGYHSQRGNFSRRRSHSRERSGYKRSRSQSPVRSSRTQQSPTDSRRRNDSSLPKKSSKRSSSDSPEPRPSKSKTTKQPSSSPSPPPAPSRSNQRLQDSDSGNASPSPPPQKKKKQRSWSPSESPQAEDEFDARQYQKSQEERGDDKKVKAGKNKGKSYAENDNYSSDDY